MSPSGCAFAAKGNTVDARSKVHPRQTVMMSNVMVV